MQTDHPPASTESNMLAAVDPQLRAFTREWFEQDLRNRIDVAMDRRLALLAPVVPAPAIELSTAA
jgi:hypothetical protein